MSEKDEAKANTKPPIMGGWRGHINGRIEGASGTSIRVDTVTVTLDHQTAWLLCNLLSDSAIQRSVATDGEKDFETLSNLGAAIGRMIDHNAANNGGRKIVK
jgi:hypothetical protein